jgi:hypothetical protein
MWRTRLLLWVIAHLAVFPEHAVAWQFRAARRRGRRDAAHLSVRVRRKSGREGDHLVDNAHTVNFRLDALVKELSATEHVNWIWFIIRRPVAWVIVRQLRNAVRHGLKGLFFRGRSYKRGEKPKDSDDFYWRQDAWQKHVSSGKWESDRYNENGERVLYLSTTARTASREIARAGCTPFMQRFELDLPNTLSVLLDHELETRFPFIHYLLLNSEFLPGESHLPNAYRATHFLAYLCACFEIDAVEYPSVKVNLKGCPGGFNLVLFRNALESAGRMMIGEPFEHK